MLQTQQEKIEKNVPTPKSLTLTLIFGNELLKDYKAKYHILALFTIKECVVLHNIPKSLDLHSLL